MLDRSFTHPGPRACQALGLFLLGLLTSAPSVALESSPDSTSIGVLGNTLGAIGIILAIMAGWYWSLKRTVAVRTRELQHVLQRHARAELELRQVATVDSRTGLATAHHFIAQVDEYLHGHQLPVEQAKEVLILKLVDLDVIVRIFGFMQAEQVVTAFAANLSKLPDALSAHLGRGVFALFINKSDTPALFDHLMVATARSNPGLSSQLVGGSAYWPEHGRSTSKLMRHAETAMAISIARRRRWMAYDAIMEPSRLDLDILSLFTDGNVSGIFPVFQPQLDLRTGKITTAEILVRWRHPTLGVIAPAVFIPLLENAGLIERITALMVDEAVRIGALLRAHKLPCAISVNIAAYDLIETQLPETISKALTRHRGLASDIKLELTETSVASDPQRIKQILLELSARGVDASVDDFGTGYSSLSYLSLFPIRELKIDRTFVGDMVTNPRNHSIVRSTIVMARELGLVTVAEGVEDDRTLQLLRQDGCDFAQGNVIARPMEEREFIEFMRTHAAQLFDVSRFMRQ